MRLGEWQSFYVIVGSSAGALTGLMFVGAALTASVRSSVESAGLRVFATPTIVHFCAVLLTAAVVNTPRHTRTSLGVCFIVIGVALLGYVGRIVSHARRQQLYSPLRSDWVWYMVLPAVAYAGIFTAGIVVHTAPSASLDIVGAAALLLLFVGIHNAWDGAVWIIANRDSG